MTEPDREQAGENGRIGVADKTFAAILGDRWRTSGDGIYTLADDADPEPADEVEAERPLPARRVHRSGSS